MRFMSHTPFISTQTVVPLSDRMAVASPIRPVLPGRAAAQIVACILSLGLPGLALAAACANGSNITTSTNCTVPAGTLVTVEVWGAGGGGGAGSVSSSDQFAGGAGGGGSYCKATFTSGGSALSLDITIGVSGAGGTSPAGGSPSAGAAGGDSTVAGIGFIDMLAAGGAGGTVNATASAAGGGAGGAACVGVTTGDWVAGFAGGAGGDAKAADVFAPGASGGGGAAASDASAGNNGSAGDASSSGGISSEGGAGDMPGNDRGGGNGAQEASPTNLDAQPGVSPGGGGGGGMYSNLVEASRLGAAGASGAVRITWLAAPVVTAPDVTTSAATGITATGATLSGMVNDNGADTTVTFDYGVDTSYGTNVAATTGAMVLAGSGSTSVARTLAGLTCNTTYHFRVQGSNSAGTTNGSDTPFATGACTTGPSVTTNAASAVGQSGATLNGSVSDVGANVSAISFEYGTTTGYGSTRAASTTSITASAGAPSSISPTATLTGLSCGTTYHFRIKATDANATNNGSDATFTTTACSNDDPGGSAGTVISGGSGTLNGGSAVLTGPASVIVTGSGSTLDASSSGAGGSTVNVGAGSSVVVSLGGSAQPVSVTGISGGTILGVSSVVTGSGTQNVLSVSSGSATLAGNGGAGLLGVGDGSSVVVTAGAGGGSIIASASGQGTTTVTVVSGTTTAPRNCGTRPSLPSTPPTGSNSSVWNTYFASVSAYQRSLLNYSLCLAQAARIVRAAGDATPVPSATLLLYKGETIVYDRAGNEAGISLADGGAGVPQVLDFRRYGISLESLPVSIDGMPARLKGANLGSAIVDGMGRLVGEALRRGPNTHVGGIAMATADGTQLTGVPVGPLRVSPRAAGGLQANGLLRIVADGVVVDLAPGLASAGNFANQVFGLDGQASVTITENGLIKASAGGAKLVLRPAWASSPSTLNGFSFDGAGHLVFGDGRMQQTLYPAFANVDALAVALGTIAGATAPTMALDGSVSTMIGSTGYRLRAGYQLISTPEARASDTWWLDGGTLYVNNHDGTAQPFTLE